MRVNLRYLSFISNVGFFVVGFCASYIFHFLNLSALDPDRHLSRFIHDPLLPKSNLVIVILSAPTNFIERDRIRNSWLKHKGKNTAHVFGVGTTGLKDEDVERLRDEKYTHNDLLMVPIIDSYRNLSLKVATCFKAVTDLFNFQFLLKIDEDSFVNIQSLEAELSKVAHPKLYWGYFSPSAHVFSRGRWKETGWYLCDKYLPYAVGGGYLLGYKLVAFIADNYQLFKLYSSEDVSVGVWLAATTSRRIHDIRFDTQAKSRGCWNDQLIKHKVSADEMTVYSRRVYEGLNLCHEEGGSNLKAYSYDWSWKPSKCCSSIDPSNISIPRIYKSEDRTQPE